MVKRFGLNFLVLIASFLLVLALTEIVLRCTIYNLKNYVQSPGPDAVYVIETAEFKTKIKTNSLNMRDGEILSKAPGEYRILCLGDSFTFGLGVNIPETYPKVAEKILRESGYRASVINGGTQGNVEDAIQFLIEKGLRFKPDLAALQIYIGNDFYDELRHENKNAGRAEEPIRRNIFLDAKRVLKGIRLRTLEFFWTRLVQIRWIDDILFRFDLRYDNRGIFLRTYPPLEKKLVTEELTGLEKIRSLCEKEGVSLVFLLVPAKQQVFKKHLLNNDKYDYKKPNRILKDFCAGYSIPCIDFLEIYETLPDETVRGFYYNQDQHWTVRGHAQAGETLAEFIREHAKPSF
ncbi:MAG: hypothetical protein HYZ52_04845 [Candidatus Omnitrophica bacterium]|nr:hypothetical protein [Candidatus Omnitrophota bacterium]